MRRGFTLMEVTVSLGLVALLLLTVFPVLGESHSLYRKRLRSREMTGILENAWERCVAGNLESYDISGIYDRYQVSVMISEVEAGLLSIKLEVKGENSGKAENAEGYLETPGFLTP